MTTAITQGDTRSDELPSKVAHSVGGVNLTRQWAGQERRESRRRRQSMAVTAEKADLRENGATLKSRGSIFADRAIIEMKQFRLGGERADTADSLDKLTGVRQREVVRQMPISIEMKRKVRDKIKAMTPEIIDSSWDTCWYNQKLARQRCRTDCLLRWNYLDSLFTFWGGSFKTIAGQFGTGVLAYFTFLKWLLFLNSFIFFLILLFIIIPQVAFPAITVTATANMTAAQNLSMTCSAQYHVNISTDPLTLALDFLQGTGWMEKTYVFYGYYSNSQMSIGTFNANSYSYNLPLAVLFTTFAIFLASLVLMVKHTAASFRASVLANSNATKLYCNKMFAGWDYSLNDPMAAVLRNKSLFKEFTADVEEQRLETERQNMSSRQRGCIYTIRILINLFVIAVLAGCGYLINYTTEETARLTKSSAYESYHAITKLLIQYMTSFTITALNALVPVIFTKLVKIEAYSPEFTVNITLLRTVFLRLASLVILVISLYTTITCEYKDACNVGTGTCTPINCWETYVGQQFYKLMVLDMLTVCGVIIFVEFPRGLIVKKCSCKLAKIIGLKEFQIPKQVLDLIYSEALLWIGFLFCPMLAPISVIKLFVFFYLKKWSLLHNYTSSSRPYKASTSNAFFMVVLLLAFAVCVFPILYIIWFLTPSRGCGPFSIYSTMVSIVDITILTFPIGLQNVLNFLTREVFEIPAFIILGVIIYYMVEMILTYRGMLKLLRDQLLMEGKDKQFLLNRVQELTGVGGEGNKITSRHKMVHSISEEKEADEKSLLPKQNGLTSGELPPNVPMDV